LRQQCNYNTGDLFGKGSHRNKGLWAIKDEPRIIQRARFVETFLREKDGQDLDTNDRKAVSQQLRGSTIIGTDYAWLEKGTR